jgi:hypothetical protein
MKANKAKAHLRTVMKGEDMASPRTYLSHSGGKYRVIHNSMPLAPDTADASQAKASAGAFRLALSPWFWEGDQGLWLWTGEGLPVWPEHG